MENKKLYRITEGKMFCGVCTGLADYFEADVSLVRLIAVASCFFSGAGLLAYIAAAVIMPIDNTGAENNEITEKEYNNNNN